MSDKRICVISLGVDESSPPNHPGVIFSDYSLGIARIRADLTRSNFRGAFLAWDQRYPKGSPSHLQSPWAFKPFCFLEAQQLGYQLILWMDASIKIRRPLESLFESISNDGYLIFENYHSVGEFCKDEALGTLDITREEAFSIPSCMAGVLGLDLSSQRSAEFLRQWTERATDGITFPGPKWSGCNGWPRTASKDPRVRGHRCDQTAASVIAFKLGMNKWKSRVLFGEFFDIDRLCVRKLRENYK